MVHGILERDWPDFERLLADYRAGRLKPHIAGAESPEPNDRRQVVGILQCRVVSGETVAIERLIPAAGEAWDLRIVPLRDGITPSGTFRLRLTADGPQSDPISVRATADELLRALVALTDSLGLPSDAIEVALGPLGIAAQTTGTDEDPDAPARCSPQRWLIRGWPGGDPPLLGDQSIISGRIDSVNYRGSLRPRIVSSWWGTGRAMTVTYPHAEPQSLLPGTLITAELIPGKGWVVTSWEDQPTYTDPVTLETRVALPCLPQTLIHGAPGVSPVCGENSPSRFEISQFVSGRGFALGSPVRSTIPWLLESGPLVHHEGNEWRTDWFGPEGFEDHFQWRLSLYETDHGPQARLELVTASPYPDVLIVYLSTEPWDCLGLNRLKRISHLSRGTADFPVWRFPQCLGVAAGGSTCARIDPEGTLFDASLCALYWSTELAGETWLAGPAARSDGAVVANGIEYEHCVYPAHLDDEEEETLQGLLVEFFVPRDPRYSAWISARFTRAAGTSQLYLRSLGPEPESYDCGGYDLDPIESFFGDDGRPLDPDDPPPAIPGSPPEPTDDPFPASLRIAPWP